VLFRPPEIVEVEHAEASEQAGAETKDELPSAYDRGALAMRVNLGSRIDDFPGRAERRLSDALAGRGSDARGDSARIAQAYDTRADCQFTVHRASDDASFTKTRLPEMVG
jgi:hypothetical protein